MATARAITDKTLDEMERHLDGIYSRASRELGDKWRKYMDNAAKRVADAQKAVDEAKKTGDKVQIAKAEEALRKKQTAVTLTDAKYRTMVSQTAAELNNVNKTAAAYVNGKLPEIYAVNYNEVSTDLGSKVGYSFNMADRNTVARLATQNDQLLPSISDVKWNRQALNAEVTQGIIQGESIDTIKMRFQRVLGMDRSCSRRNARTAVTAAENRGRMDMMHDAQELGIEVKKVWMALHDDRTREAHADLDKVEAEVDEPFQSELGEIMFPGDSDAEDPANIYNCRCTLGYNIYKNGKLISGVS